MRILIAGAGGHGRVVADAILAGARTGREVQCVGFLDDDPALLGAAPLGLRALGALSQVAQFPHDALVVAIGSNSLRREWMEAYSAAGETFACVVHPSASIGAASVLGDGSVACAGSVIGVEAYVGRGVILNTCSSVDHHCQIGDYCHIAPGAHLGGEVILREGVFVGMGACVLPGVTIGEWSTLGAGAVVLHNVSPYTTVVGVPARVIHHKKD